MDAIKKGDKVRRGQDVGTVISLRAGTMTPDDKKWMMKATVDFSDGRRLLIQDCKLADLNRIS